MSIITPLWQPELHGDWFKPLPKVVQDHVRAVTDPALLAHDLRQYLLGEHSGLPPIDKDLSNRDAITLLLMQRLAKAGRTPEEQMLLQPLQTLLVELNSYLEPLQKFSYLTVSRSAKQQTVEGLTKLAFKTNPVRGKRNESYPCLLSLQMDFPRAQPEYDDDMSAERPRNLIQRLIHLLLLVEDPFMSALLKLPGMGFMRATVVYYNMPNCHAQDIHQLNQKDYRDLILADFKNNRALWQHADERVKKAKTQAESQYYAGQSGFGRAALYFKTANFIQNKEYLITWPTSDPCFSTNYPQWLHCAHEKTIANFEKKIVKILLRHIRKYPAMASMAEPDLLNPAEHQIWQLADAVKKMPDTLAQNQKLQVTVHQELLKLRYFLTWLQPKAPSIAQQDPAFTIVLNVETLLLLRQVITSQTSNMYFQDGMKVITHPDRILLTADEGLVRAKECLRQATLTWSANKESTIAQGQPVAFSADYTQWLAQLWPTIAQYHPKAGNGFLKYWQVNLSQTPQAYAAMLHEQIRQSDQQPPGQPALANSEADNTRPQPIVRRGQRI